MSGEQALAELNKLRVDCMLGKKKHYNARDRYSRRHTQVGVAIVLIFAKLNNPSLRGHRLLWDWELVGLGIG